ncbi:S41 family peptidase [Sphingobacterium sp. FBM7-1]|uniref:S41 family peptidase n=1 Tax=Sphingobacterium sp. FBM7-1 TaxID=2886688 RepID=UPI001D11D547|nr:S41 family peptidase [Sphingobacterium sp. FBM7-1]MCC2598850.1 hypothetical protein [Sphingobacterium sp. FBM7-1]
MSLYRFFLVLVCLGLTLACKKEITNPPDPIVPIEPTEQDRLKATIYDYYNKYSLWTEQIPDLDEQGRVDFVKEYSSNNSLLTALKNMTPRYSFVPYQTLDINVGNHYDRYSFLEEAEASNSSSRAAGLRMDPNEGYGIQFGWGVIGDVDYALPVITFVEGGSPAQKAGVKRGMIVYAVNNEGFIANLTEAGKVDDVDNREFEKRLEVNSLTLKVKTLATLGEEGTDYSMNYSSSYAINPVILDSVYTVSEKNIGYLAYSSFEEEYLGTGVDWNRMEKVFTGFEQKHIKDLILDLRYNTGGYVETARYLANKIIGASGDKQPMFSYKTNHYLAVPRNVPFGLDFDDVNFERDNALNLSKVIVLVTEQTASAAELLINVLRPYMEVTLIGDTGRTYGKPVGFFPQEIGDVTLWVTSFQTLNKDGQSDYWNGLSVDVPGVADYFFKDFGDSTEDMIAMALERVGVAPKNDVRASARNKYVSPRAVGLGMINKVKERNMLKTRE